MWLVIMVNIHHGHSHYISPCMLMTMDDIRMAMVIMLVMIMLMITTMVVLVHLKILQMVMFMINMRAHDAKHVS